MRRKPGGGEARAKASPPSAFDAAAKMLASRERSAAELRLALARKGYDREEIVRALLRLAETGLQSDARFAEVFAGDAAGRRGYAGRAVRARLRAKGVSAEHAAQATAERPEEEEARARRVAERRAAALSPLPAEVRVRRLAAFLGRRGYPEELCLRLAEELGRAERENRP